VLVRSTPSGAHVFVDGRDRGQTPATIRELSQGEHRIRLERSGYTTSERRFTLSSRQPSQSLSIRLAREKADVSPKPTAKASANAADVGKLVVESRPQGASVVVDGRRVGTTPLSLGDLKAGHHAIRLERDGYRVWTAGVDVAAGESRRVTGSLEK